MLKEELRDQSGSEAQSLGVAPGGGQMKFDTQLSGATAQTHSADQGRHATHIKTVSQAPDHHCGVTQTRPVRGEISNGGQCIDDTHDDVAADVDEGGQGSDETHFPITPLIDEIREQWRMRVAWHKEEKALTLRCKALCRRIVGGDKKEADVLYNAILGKGDHALVMVGAPAIAPLVFARDHIEANRKAVEKRLAKLAKDLPVAPWVADVRGFGIASLAAVVGEAGDITTYSNPAKLWKRMGLAVMGDGTRQRRISGADALEHGYSPSRRSVMWNIGTCIIKAGGAYKEIYNTRKEYELTRVETKAHAHNRAQRYMEKRLLRDLWSAWRAAINLAEPRKETPPAPHSPEGDLTATDQLATIHATPSGPTPRKGRRAATSRVEPTTPAPHVKQPKRTRKAA